MFCLPYSLFDCWIWICVENRFNNDWTRLHFFHKFIYENDKTFKSWWELYQQSKRVSIRGRVRDSITDWLCICHKASYTAVQFDGYNHRVLLHLARLFLWRIQGPDIEPLHSKFTCGKIVYSGNLVVVVYYLKPQLRLLSQHNNNNGGVSSLFI